MATPQTSAPPRVSAWLADVPLLRDLLRFDAPIAFLEERWLGRSLNVHVYTVGLRVTDEPKAFFAEMKRAWKNAGATSMAGDALGRSATGPGWSARAWRLEGIFELAADLTCSEDELSAGIRRMAEDLPPYPALLELASARGSKARMMVRRWRAEQSERAGLLFDAGLTCRDLEAHSASLGYASGADELWRGSDGNVFKIWEGNGGTTVSMNL